MRRIGEQYKAPIDTSQSQRSPANKNHQKVIKNNLLHYGSGNEGAEDMSGFPRLGLGDSLASEGPEGQMTSASADESKASKSR